jgi:hypothetical protein
MPAAVGDPHGMVVVEPRIRSYLDGEAWLELPTSDRLDAPGADSRSDRSDVQSSLIACSRCLRVLRDERWLRAETAIWELRTFEDASPPRFEAVLCPLCSFSIRLRRAQPRAHLRSDTARSRGRY